MVSFQQISIGAICLVAAFAFGNYVNNHPPTDPNQAAIQTHSESAIQPGNVQSRLTVSGLDVVEKRPAPIATMRQPIKPRFAVPLSATNETTLTNNDSVALPPPSQLGQASAMPQMAISDRISGLVMQQPDLSSESVLPLRSLHNEVPDFSSIIAEFENSPIALKSTGNMPLHSQSTGNPTAIAKTKRQQADAARSLVIDQPTFDSADPRSFFPQDVARQNLFSEDDFAPKLKDGFANLPSNTRPAPGHLTSPSRPSNDRVVASREGLAESLGFRYADPPAPEGMSDKPHQASVISAAQDVAAFDDPANRWNNKPPSSLAPISPIDQRNQPSSLGKTLESATNRRSNHVVSRQPLPAPIADENWNSSGSQRRSVLVQPRKNSLSALSDASVNRADAPTRLAKDDQVKTMLPFGLNDQGRKQLVAIKSRANLQLDLSSTKFVDHVIQPGETLQSISKRYFGKPDYYLDIYLANRQKLSNPVDTPDGIAIRIPVY